MSDKSDEMLTKFVWQKMNTL